jgi:outer membrane lipoprotein-sorting protein
MKAMKLGAAAGLVPVLLLSGCSYLVPSKRRLPVPKAPALVHTVTPRQLVASLNERWEKLQALTATVEVYATEYKTEQGEAKNYPGARASIVIAKPQMLRVRGTYFGVMAFDLASNGDNFTLEIPSKNLVIKGSNTAKGTSKNTWENLRPGFFFNAMVVRGVEPDDHYFVTSDTETIEDPTKKHLYSVPEYILNINRVDPNSPIETPVRVVTFHRDDLLPYEQDIYNKQGEMETQVVYQDYRRFDSVQYPSTVTITSPINGFKLVMMVESVHENMKLPADEFQLQLPSGMKVQQLQ